MVMTMLERRGVFKGPRAKSAAFLTQLTLSECRGSTSILTTVGLSLGVFLPPAIAYFPQTAATSAAKLEPQFKNVQGPIYFNKGL